MMASAPLWLNSTREWLLHHCRASKLPCEKEGARVVPLAQNKKNALETISDYHRLDNCFH